MVNFKMAEEIKWLRTFVAGQKTDTRLEYIQVSLKRLSELSGSKDHHELKDLLKAIVDESQLPTDSPAERDDQQSLDEARRQLRAHQREECMHHTANGVGKDYKGNNREELTALIRGIMKLFNLSFNQALGALDWDVWNKFFGAPLKSDIIKWQQRVDEAKRVKDATQKKLSDLVRFIEANFGLPCSEPQLRPAESKCVAGSHHESAGKKAVQKRPAESEGASGSDCESDRKKNVKSYKFTEDDVLNIINSFVPGQDEMHWDCFQSQESALPFKGDELCAARTKHRCTFARNRQQSIAPCGHPSEGSVGIMQICKKMNFHPDVSTFRRVTTGILECKVSYELVKSLPVARSRMDWYIKPDGLKETVRIILKLKERNNAFKSIPTSELAENGFILNAVASREPPEPAPRPATSIMATPTVSQDSVRAGPSSQVRTNLSWTASP
jgi:hypothetical protein